MKRRKTENLEHVSRRSHFNHNVLNKDLDFQNNCVLCNDTRTCATTCRRLNSQDALFVNYCELEDCFRERMDKSNDCSNDLQSESNCGVDDVTHQSQSSMVTSSREQHLDKLTFLLKQCELAAENSLQYVDMTQFRVQVLQSQRSVDVRGNTINFRLLPALRQQADTNEVAPSTCAFELSQGLKFPEEGKCNDEF